jgi:hypothetical protein
LPLDKLCFPFPDQVLYLVKFCDGKERKMIEEVQQGESCNVQGLPVKKRGQILDRQFLIAQRD